MAGKPVYGNFGRTGNNVDQGKIKVKMRQYTLSKIAVVTVAKPAPFLVMQLQILNDYLLSSNVEIFA